MPMDMAGVDRGATGFTKSTGCTIMAGPSVPGIAARFGPRGGRAET